MNVDTPTALLYHTYNSLFLSLPFSGIEDTGTRLALFNRHCQAGFAAGKKPSEVIDAFFGSDGEASSGDPGHYEQLLYFIQYAERQVVLFDSVEDALFRQTHDLNGPGSVKNLIARLNTPARKEKLLEKIRDFNLRLVLTAHPTQFYPGKVLGIINDLGDEIREHHLENIRQLLLQLGKTSFLNREKPTPFEEAVSLGWFLENVFFRALPDIVYRLLRALNQDVVAFENPQLLALGFWPGGDRDGNPNVTAETTAKVAGRLRESILRCYHREIRRIRRRLTFKNVEDHLADAENRIYATLYQAGEAGRYGHCGELLDDLVNARNALDADPDSRHLGEFRAHLDRFILKVRVFGFYFASLDIRQDSRKHGEVWEEIFRYWKEHGAGFDAAAFENAGENGRIDMLLDTRIPLDANNFDHKLARETLLSFRAIADIQRTNGEAGCHRYIISNCRSALNVAEVLALAQLTIGDPVSGVVPLDIVPLFETVEDLAACGGIMHTLYAHPHYARHLAGRGNVQHVMLGFSDGTKDGGYLRANWSIYRAKETLTKVSRDNGVTIVFFDGRGGPPGRGGGNNASYYASHGSDIENKAIHVTIQGQTISSSYGTQDAAAYNIERLLTAGLENHLFPEQAPEMTAKDMRLMDTLAEHAHSAYLGLKNHPDFVPYLEKMTPLKWYGDTNIASRPTKRGSDAGLAFEDLRAIPFVGAWAQMKQNVPGYYGLGSALAYRKSAGLSEIRDLYRRSLFFRTLLENSMQSLSKSNFNLTAYQEGHPRFSGFWKMLRDEYILTDKVLKLVSGQQNLLSENPTSQVSIALREEIVWPLIAIQQYALEKLQDRDLPPEAAERYRKLVLRAMFGIINAARNAA